jgi:hypothetical protein
MNEPDPWIDEGGSPASLHALRPALPRLQIIHLMMWMTATAAAFVPYRMQEAVSGRLGSGAVSSPTFLWALYGISQGAAVFVTAALIWWGLRAYVVRLEPGHHLALQAATYWLLSSLAWATSYVAEGDVLRTYSWLSATNMLVSLAFFFWFLRLAIRGGESRAWRWAFLVFAAAPLVSLLVYVGLAFFANSAGGGGNNVTFVAIQGGLAALQLAALSVAAVGDVRCTIERHWSHWIATCGRLVALAGIIAYYAWCVQYLGSGAN